jgi:exonuclease V gamma subunit
MEQEIKEEIKSDVPSTSTEPTVNGEDPLKTELVRVQGRSKVDKLLYTKSRIDNQLKELGVDDEEPEDEDEKPLTRGEFRKMQAENAIKSSLQLADEIPNETERELLKYHLQNTIRSTGDPKQDFELARGLVNAVKNKQILEEVNRKGTPVTHSSGSGAPAKAEKQPEFTKEELGYMKSPFNLSKEQILAARPK